MSLPLADWINWMEPFAHSFVLIKFLLLPVVGIYALVQRRKFKQKGIEPHESEAELGKPARPMWVNQTLDQPPAAPPASGAGEQPPGAGS